jgi:hypothetical protein
MRKAILFLILLLAGASAAFGQSYLTAVTGTVTDPNGYPYAAGTIQFNLVTPGGVSPYITALGTSAYVQGFYGPYTLTSNGSFAVTIPDNTKITPASTTWNVTVCSQPPGPGAPVGTGAQCFSINATISGASQSLTVALDAAAPAIVNALPSGACPAPGLATLGCVKAINSVSHQWVSSLSTAGALGLSQPAYSDLATGPLLNFALAPIGPGIGSAGFDVSADVGRVAGLSVNLANSAGTVTGFRGIDSRVSDAGTAAEDVGVQGLGTKTAGDSTSGGHSLWGGNFIASITGGKTSNVYGVYGEADVASGTTVTGGSCALCFVNGIQGYGHASAGATLTNAVVTGGTFVAGQQAGDAKAYAAVLALLEGRISQATTGVGALFKGGNFNNQVNPDFGLDFDTTINSVALAFNTADIRMASGVTLAGTAASVNSSAALGTAPVVFATLPACAAGTEGLMRAVTDSTTNTWGNTITGGGGDHVLAYCDGTNWTVAAK